MFLRNDKQLVPSKIQDKFQFLDAIQCSILIFSRNVPWKKVNFNRIFIKTYKKRKMEYAWSVSNFYYSEDHISS